MKRNAALVPLSHDHHHALVAARRLRRGADGRDPMPEAAAFLAFFALETVRHFREEEELLFPKVADLDEARELLVEALLDHQRIHSLAARLTALVAAGTPAPAVMRELGERLDAHVRLEERQLFPLIEQLVPADALAALPLGEAGARAGNGPLWGLASEELNATMLWWNAGEGPAEHINDERDALVLVVAGSLTIDTDDGMRELRPAEAAIVEKGRRRKLTAGPEGAQYLSVHRRRGGLQIKSAPAG